MTPGSPVKYTNLIDDIDEAEFVDISDKDGHIEDGLIKQILRLFPELSHSPIMSYYSNNEIPQLEKHIHSSEDSLTISNKGVHIFLFEPLCFYEVPEQPLEHRIGYHNFGFYSELSNDIDINDVRSLELDSIAEYVNNNNIDNASVYVCEYNATDLKHYEPFFNLITSDQFLKASMLFNNIKTTFTQPKFNKHFISTNWRYTSARNIISSLLCTENANLSWTFKYQWDNLNKLTWINNNLDSEFASVIKKQFDILNSQVPRCVDFTSKEPDIINEPPAGHHYPANVEKFNVGFNPVSWNRFELPLEQFYSESFVDIVNESRFAQPISGISEKTFQAIQFFTPFIVVAPAKSLEYIRSLGFKTFNIWWDESYDLEPDHWKRLEKIYSLIKTISLLDLKECEKITQEMQPVLEYNFKVLCDFVGREHQIEVPEWDEKEFNVQHRNNVK